MSPKNDCQKPCCRHYRGLWPNATSSPIRIPYTNLPMQKPVPLILRNNDSTPGVVHIPIPDITDYVSSHYPKTVKPSTKIFEHTDPVRLGVRAPPDFMAKPPPQKDVKIVPDHLPAQENIRERNQWLWERNRVLEERTRNEKTARRAMETEMCGDGTSERNWREGRSDSGVDVVISFV